MKGKMKRTTSGFLAVLLLFTAVFAGNIGKCYSGETIEEIFQMMEGPSVDLELSVRDHELAKRICSKQKNMLRFHKTMFFEKQEDEMLCLQDIYEMTQEENVFSAKRILVDSVYSQANLEGIAVTYAQTVDILNNVNVEKITPKDISKVCCLRDTWKYVIDNIDASLDLGFLETIHEIVARFDVDYRYLGKLRTDEVIIGGTRWRPEIPDIEKLHTKLVEMEKNPNITDRAIRTGLWIMRAQPFMDGNKRVGSFVINKILIENGRGLFNVPVELDGAFKEKLVSYYESDNPENLILWIAQNCMDGTHKIAEPTMKEVI